LIETQRIGHSECAEQQAQRAVEQDQNWLKPINNSKALERNAKTHP